MDGTIIGQGSFLAQYPGPNPNPGVASDQAGSAQIIQIPSGVDWLYVYNYTKFGQAGLNTVYFNGTANAVAGVEFYWQRGMAPGTGIVKYKGNAVETISADTLLTGGFTLYDPSGNTPGALPLLGPAVATTASTNATQPVVSTASTAGLYVGSVVRMSNTAQSDVNGIDMIVSAITVNTNFTLLAASNALANAPGAIGGAGFYRIVNFNQLFYPRRRYITNITQAVNPTVSTSIPHGYVAGQHIRFEIPKLRPAAGMVQLDGVLATILSVVDDYSFIIDIDTSAFSLFVWPTIANQPSSFPAAVPVGENTANALLNLNPQVPSIGGQQIFNTGTGILSDSEVNTGFLGMILGGGGNGNILGTPIAGPAGTVHYSAGDVITVRDQMYWRAGKSTYGGL